MQCMHCSTDTVMQQLTSGVMMDSMGSTDALVHRQQLMLQRVDMQCTHCRTDIAV